MTILTFAFYVVSCLAISNASVQDVYNQLPGGFLPSPVKYFKQSGDQLAMESGSSAGAATDGDSSAAVVTDGRPQQPRLGLPIYSGTSLNGGGYSASGAGVYSPLKLDLGGLLLGTVVGLGAVLIIPKLLHVFSYSANSYGHYGRSEQGVTSELTEMASRVDRALAEYNVSTSECLQRALCSWQTPADGQPSGVAAAIAAVSSNPLMSFLLEGSRLERAVEVGRSGVVCATAFPRCPVTGDSLYAGLSAITNSIQT